jgi:hypothetical protein
MNDLRNRLRIEDEQLNAINDFLLDPESKEPRSKLRGIKDKNLKV